MIWLPKQEYLTHKKLSWIKNSKLTKVFYFSDNCWAAMESVSVLPQYIACVCCKYYFFLSGEDTLPRKKSEKYFQLGKRKEQ